MSEYWVSKKKYYCQYCEIYIADDAPSRSQHENGLRHKGSKDRFIRGLYKAGVKKKQESEEEKREMKRVEQAAQEAYARDIGAGHAAPAPSTSAGPSAPASKPKPPPPKPSDPYTNYTTAASLGITDPDVERLVAEAEMRKNEGRAGDWMAVVPPPPPLPPPQNGEASTQGGVKVEPGGSAGEVRKREEEPADDDTRYFKMRKKTTVVGLGEIYDPGIIRVKPRVEPSVKSEETLIASSSSLLAQGPTLGGDAPQGDVKGNAIDKGPKATERPAWTRREWKWAGEEEEPKAASPPNGTHVNSESHPGVAMSAPSENHDDPPEPAPKKEDPADSEMLSSGSLFRKRKVPAVGGASTRGRRKG